MVVLDYVSCCLCWHAARSSHLHRMSSHCTQRHQPRTSSVVEMHLQWNMHVMQGALDLTCEGSHPAALCHAALPLHPLPRSQHRRRACHAAYVVSPA